MNNIGLTLGANNSYCYEAVDMTVSNTRIGLITDFDGAGLSFQRMILAENDWGSQAAFSSLADENTLNYTNMVFLAMARPNFKYCYTVDGSCQNKIAIWIPPVI